MNPRTLIIAFLSPRYPAAYTEHSIAHRLNASKMLDRRVTPEEVADDLRALHKLGLVDLQIDQLDNSAVWQITEAGSKKWVLEGRISVV